MLAGNLTWKPQILEILSQEFPKTDFFWFFFFVTQLFVYLISDAIEVPFSCGRVSVF